MLLLFQRGAVGALRAAGRPGAGARRRAAPVHLAFAIDASDRGVGSAAGELGIAIESRVTWERGGISLYFRDPDDRSVELATPGIWPCY